MPGVDDVAGLPAPRPIVGRCKLFWPGKDGGGLGATWPGSDGAGFVCATGAAAGTGTGCGAPLPRPCPGSAVAATGGACITFDGNGCSTTCILSYLEQRLEYDGRDDPAEPKDGLYAALSLQEGGGPFTQFSPLAKMRAVVVFPTPRGPENR